MPRPRPAARAMRPRSPPAAPSAANAGLATSRASAAKTKLPKRFMLPLSASSGLCLSSSSPLPARADDEGRCSMMMLVAAALVRDRARDVDGRQHGEHERLHDADEEPERVERDRHRESREIGENLDHLVIREHVRVEPDAERNRP